LTVTDLEFAELMSGGVWQTLLSAQPFAVAEGEGEIRLRQLLLGILLTYSEHEKSEGLSANCRFIFDNTIKLSWLATIPCRLRLWVRDRARRASLV
jgi:hypothetical protein